MAAGTDDRIVDRRLVTAERAHEALLGRGTLAGVARAKHPPGTEPFDVTLPDGFELGENESSLEVAAQQAGWTVERDGATVVVRDVWTENEDHAAWLVASKVGLSPERVSVWAGRDS
jgi:hypothetical protein